MPVDTKHEDYEASLPDWQMMRDVMAGQRAIHKAGETYLTKLHKQTDREYSDYRDRAGFYGATARTKDALGGLLFRKDPAIVVPPALDDLALNIDGEGSTIADLAQQAVDEILETGRLGMLVDFPPAPDQGQTVVTLDRARRDNLRAFVTCYKAENILNWRTTMVGARRVLSLLVLWEMAPGDSADSDEFENDLVPQIRVLDLESGTYRVRLFRQTTEGGEWEQHGADIFPTVNSQRWREIPFTFLSPLDTKPDVKKPPLLDMGNLNISHYRTTADLEHGLHWAALPTPVITGHRDDENDEYRIGSAAAWVFPESEASAKFLEFTGAGLGEIKSALEAKETRMAAIGARMLAPEKRSAEAAETLSIRSAGENAALSNVGLAVSAGMTMAVQNVARWQGADPDQVEINLNTDFNPASMSAQEITSLLQAWQSGAISKSTLFDNLQAGEIIDGETTFEDEEARILDEGGAAAALPVDTPPGPQDDVA